MIDSVQNSKVIRSRIKNIFSEELLKLIASICDTKRIDSSQRKMKILQQLLKKYEVRFDVLGGATNRIVLFIDGYAIKFAMDRQGYKDNLMEYSLSPELQPYVTKIYETNGYILVAEPVRTMSINDFNARKIDILKTLEILSMDYLLGDVGFVKKNFTNWGIRDDGSVVILDFAYCHRATERLFTCKVCGDGMLTYDGTYSHLRCTNSTVCTTKYTYNEIKMIQGDQVDLDMIDEAKKDSITMGPSEVTKTMYLNDGLIVDHPTQTVNTVEDYVKYIEEVKYMFATNFTQDNAVDLMLERLNASKRNDVEAIASIDQQIEDVVGKIEEVDVPDGINAINSEPQFYYTPNGVEQEQFITMAPLDINDSDNLFVQNESGDNKQDDSIEANPESVIPEVASNHNVVYEPESEEDLDSMSPLDRQIELLRRRRLQNQNSSNAIVEMKQNTNVQSQQQEPEFEEDLDSMSPLDRQIELLRRRRLQGV